MTEIEEESILVAVRIRPLSKKELSAGIQSCCQTLGERNIAIRKAGDANAGLKSQQTILNEYAFDAVFDDKSTQEDVYANTAKKYIPNFVSGKNVTVFAYGATGAGKTHTMLGNSRADSSAKDAGPGIIPCAVRDIFDMISRREQSQVDRNIDETYAMSLGYIEVYNEQVYDLLGGSEKPLAVREDQVRGIVVIAGMQEQVVKNYDQVIDYMMQGNRNRKTEATMANAVSSRSHAVLQLTLRRTILRQDTNKETVIESKLSLIDLAGSERASATNNSGLRLQEGAKINKSLLALANCINALSESTGSGKKSNVVFRDSKLTLLLKSSLEGNGNLIMIANVNPSDTTYEDSNNTLKYANRAKNIKVNPTVQETAKDTTWLEREVRMRSENAALRAKVADLTRLLTEAQEFRNEVISLCARGAFLEEVQLYAEGKESFGEFLASDRSVAAAESDTSFSGGDTSHDDSTPSRSSAKDSPEPVFQAPAEMNLRSKRRASMSGVPTKTSSRSAIPASMSDKVSLPAVAAVVTKSPQETLFDSEDDTIPVANPRKRRASCLPTATATAPVIPAAATAVLAPAPAQVPVPAPPAPPARQSARRTSLAPKLLSSTIAATRAAVDAAAAAASGSTKAAPKVVDALAGRVTRRKSLVLSATAPSAALAASDSSAEASDSDSAKAPAVPDASPAVESESVAVSTLDISEKVLPTVDESAEEPNMHVKRRTQIRRGSLGGASSTTGATDAADPLRSSNRRRSMAADVTAMLDSVRSLLPTASAAVPGASKKRAVEENDENARRKNARIDLSDIPELQDSAPAHVYMDI